MGDGFTVALDDLTRLRKTWSAQQALITPMTGRLSGLIGEIADAANAAMSGRSRGEQAEIAALATSAQQAVNAALNAVQALSGQLSADADNLTQTADAYRRAEQAAAGHAAGVSQLASYSPPPGGNPAAGGSPAGVPGDGGSASGGGGAAFAVGGGFAGGGASGGGGASDSGGAVSGGGGTGTPVAPSAPATSAQVKGWVQQAIKIMEEHGVPASKLDPNAIALIIEHESGGNPNAINNWDSNAVAGHPSQGLMQTIASTFSAYSLPGHGNILDPVDNIIAGCQYAISRYGSLDSVPGVAAVASGGSYVGY